MIYALTDVPGGRWSWEELPQHNLKVFAEYGFRLFQLDLFLEHLWLVDDRFDLTLAKKQIQGVLEVCPEAAVILRFHVNPPKWWIQAHPEECVQYFNAEAVPDIDYGLQRILEDDNRRPVRQSLASHKWRESAAEKVKQFCEAFSREPEGAALAGLQVAAGTYGEWHYWGFQTVEADASEPMRRCFQEWLCKKYGTESALRTAWNEPKMTFEQVSVPTVRERETTAGIFRDPTREQKVIDYYQCQHQVVADAILHFCKVIKTSWPRPIITGTFYGYFFSVFGRQAAGGHLQLQRVLESECVDYLCGPQAYYPETEEYYRSRALVESVRLHGKLWLDEMDQQPYLSQPDSPLDFGKNPHYQRQLQKSAANLRRNILFSLSKGAGLWFYDFGVAGVSFNADIPKVIHRGSQGWWDEPNLMRNIQQIKELVTRRLFRPFQSDADVLFVCDTDSFYYTASLKEQDPVSHTLINWVSLALFKSSVVYDEIHLDDLELVDLSQYKVIVFGNTFFIRDAVRKMIREKVLQEGRHVVWFYAPGFSNGEKLSPDFISEVTGLKVKPTRLTQTPEISFESGRGEVRYKTGEKPFSPIFTVAESGGEVFGRYLETGEPAIVRQSLTDSVAWYVGLPPEAPEILEEIIQQSGVHIYSTSGDLIYAGGGLLVVYTRTGGRRVITLKNQCEVVLDLPEGPATVILDAESGVLLGGE